MCVVLFDYYFRYNSNYNGIIVKIIYMRNETLRAPLLQNTSGKFASVLCKLQFCKPLLKLGRFYF